MENLENDSKISVSRLESTSSNQEIILADISFNRYDCSEFHALNYAANLLSNEEPRGMMLKLSSEVLREERIGDTVTIIAKFDRHTAK